MRGLMLDRAVPPPDLEAFVLEKLLQVIGAPAAAQTVAAAKQHARLDRIATREHVLAVARVLATEGGFVGIVGDLIALEASQWRTP